MSIPAVPEYNTGLILINLSFNVWDITLLLAVSTMSTILAYMENPKLKAFILTLPIPFTIATVSLGRQVDTTNMMGLVVLLAFTHAVRILHYDLKLPIVLSIVISALGYCTAGTWLAHAVPVNEYTFWMAFVFTIALGTILYLAIPQKEEPGHRSPLPIWIKLPAIMCVIVLLVIVKKMLQGFMTVFPMVGVVAAYEARHSLWTIGRQIPVIMLTLGPMMAVIHIAQKHFGTGTSIAIGWSVFLVILIPFTKNIWSPTKNIEVS
ncbi:MAG: hypothetical protein ACYC27_18955 [Armatimonadota bacterium]